MNLFLAGASGRTGKEVMELAMERGHGIHALVRDSGRVSIASPKLKVFAGDPYHAPDVHGAMTGCDAVIGCLNISRNSDFPWSKLRAPPDLLSVSAELMIPRKSVAEFVLDILDQKNYYGKTPTISG